MAFIFNIRFNGPNLWNSIGEDMIVICYDFFALPRNIISNLRLYVYAHVFVFVCLCMFVVFRNYFFKNRPNYVNCKLFQQSLAS